MLLNLFVGFILIVSLCFGIFGIMFFMLIIFNFNNNEAEKYYSKCLNICGNIVLFSIVLAIILDYLGAIF